MIPTAGIISRKESTPTTSRNFHVPLPQEKTNKYTAIGNPKTCPNIGIISRKPSFAMANANAGMKTDKSPSSMDLRCCKASLKASAPRPNTDFFRNCDARWEYSLALLTASCSSPSSSAIPSESYSCAIRLARLTASRNGGSVSIRPMSVARLPDCLDSVARAILKKTRKEIFQTATTKYFISADAPLQQRSDR